MGQTIRVLTDGYRHIYPNKVHVGTCSITFYICHFNSFYMHAALHAIRAFACDALAQKLPKFGCIHYRLPMYLHGLIFLGKYACSLLCILCDYGIDIYFSRFKQLVTKFNGFRICTAAVELYRALLYGRREKLSDAQSPLKFKGGAVGSVEDLHVRSGNTFYHFFHEWIMRTAKDYGVYFLARYGARSSLRNSVISSPSNIPLST